MAGSERVDESLGKRQLRITRLVSVGGRLDDGLAGEEIAGDSEIVALDVAVPTLAVVAGEGERSLVVDAVELAVRGTVVGVEQGPERVVDGEPVGQILDGLSGRGRR